MKGGAEGHDDLAKRLNLRCVDHDSADWASNGLSNCQE